MKSSLTKSLLGALFLSLFTLSVGPHSLAECTWKRDVKRDPVLEWTAFKTTKKLPVKGTFKKIQVSGQAPAAGSISASATSAYPPEDFFSSQKIIIDSLTVSSGDIARDTTLKNHFFSNWKNEGKIEVQFEKSSASEKPSASANKATGTLTAKIELNDVTRKIPFTYKMIDVKGDEKTIQLQGSMDILAFQGQRALSALSKACSDLHKGPDGVSKTWSDVALNATIPVIVQCK